MIDENLVVTITKKILNEINLKEAEEKKEKDNPDLGDLGIFNDVNEAVECAKEAQKKFALMDLEKREEIIAAIREACFNNARLLAELAVSETGRGRVEDKVAKNILAVKKTPGTEDLKPTAWTGDRGLTLVEMAPVGVIASITPVTNPTATIINNTISMLAAGNAVVFNPHPSAKKPSNKAVEII
ncbi:MAG TPA: aldehyde dehydrogenase EutE, partial [Thermoanaerobacter sp.]|nr:aldehyde dehydrogenase EutE [Thermoanaerobacter sp.]